MAWLADRECACVAVDREYVGTMQCSFSVVTAVVIAQHVEKMAALILSPANCEIRAVIRFLHAQKQSTAEIHCLLCHLYGSDIIVTVWSDDGAGNSLKAEPMYTEKTVVADCPWWRQNCRKVCGKQFCRNGASNFRNSLVNSPRCHGSRSWRLTPKTQIYKCWCTGTINAAITVVTILRSGQWISVNNTISIYYFTLIFSYIYLYNLYYFHVPNNYF